MCVMRLAMSEMDYDKCKREAYLAEMTVPEWVRHQLGLAEVEWDILPIVEHTDE